METLEKKEDIIKLISEAPTLKPDNLIIPDTQWKFVLRNIYRGKNIMMTGPTGTGKTLTAQEAAKILNRPYFYFNMGSTQDPRSTLIGNTFFDKEKGTFFSESEFIKAIKTENAVILCDELTRSHPEAINILMTITDPNQKYIRLDEADGQNVVRVAKGVSFIATANIGAEYTSTRTLDRAILDRFQICEMVYLTQKEESKILQYHYPKLEVALINSISAIASATREEVSQGAGKLSTAISSRVTREFCDILSDGFHFEEAIQVCVMPYYSVDGGTDSERAYIKQIVQKHMPIDAQQKKNLFNDKDFKFPISDNNPFN